MEMSDAKSLGAKPEDIKWDKVFGGIIDELNYALQLWQ
jgi:hypothetical protein